MSLRSVARVVAGGVLMLVSVVAAQAGAEASRVAAFRTLHGLSAGDPALLERLAADLQTSMNLPPGEGGPFLLGATQATLAAFPDMPEGYAALLGGASRGAADLENPHRMKSVLTWSYMAILGAPDPWAGAGPELFARLVRACNQRAHLPNMTYAERLLVLRGGLSDLSERTGVLPSPLHGLALANLEGCATSCEPAVAFQVVTRGAAALVVHEAEDGRSVYLKTGLAASGENTPVGLARQTMVRFASAGADSDHMPDVDRARLRTALHVSAAMDDDAQANQVLRTAFEMMLLATGV